MFLLVIIYPGSQSEYLIKNDELGGGFFHFAKCYICSGGCAAHVAMLCAT